MNHKFSSINLFYLSKLFELPNFWMPFVYIYLTQTKGLPEYQVFFLLGLQEFLLIFLEIPTGAVADKISRKLSIGLGYIITFLPFLLFPFVKSFEIFVLLFSIKALGRALVSGADTSLLYDILQDENRKEEFKNILSKSKSFTFGFTAVCIFLSGFIAQYNIDLLFILPFPFAVLGAIATFLIAEPKISIEQKKLQESVYLKHILKAFLDIIRNKNLYIPILVFAILDSIAVQMKFIYTPILASMELNFGLIGGITTFVYIIRSVMGYVNSKYMGKDDQRNLLIGTFISTVAFLIIGFFLNPMIFVIMLLVSIYSENLSMYSIHQKIHNLLTGETRATSMSVINFISSFFAASILWIFGFISQTSTMSNAILFISTLFAFTFLLNVVTKLKDNKLNLKV